MSNVEKNRITKSQVYKTGYLEFLKSDLPGWSAKEWERFQVEEAIRKMEAAINTETTKKTNK